MIMDAASIIDLGVFSPSEYHVDTRTFSSMHFDLITNQPMVKRLTDKKRQQRKISELKTKSLPVLPHLYILVVFVGLDFSSA